MRAAQLYENQHLLKIEEVETPTLKDGEALIQIGASGLCGTDLKLIHGFLKPGHYPHTLGHEVYGKVVAVSPSNSSEEENAASVSGKTVLVHPYITCGQCNYCLTDRMNLCPRVRRIGFELPGGFTEYVKAPIRNLVPTTLGHESAILTDAGSTMLHALRKAEIKPGDKTIVIGVGGLGTFAVQLAKLMGSEVVALDVKEEKLSFAQQLGADKTINVEGMDPRQVREAIVDKNGGELADVVVDLVGNESSQKLWPHLLSPNGKVVQVGYSEASYKDVQLKDVVYREFQLLGSLASTLTDLRNMTRLVESGKIRLNVTDRYRLDEINRAINEFEQNRIVGRAVILPR